MASQKSSTSYRPGVSGNPGGYTKAQASARRRASDLISEETDGGKEIILFAIAVMRGAAVGEDAIGYADAAAPWDEKSRRWAAQFLADRLWGKAPLVVEVSRQSEVKRSDMREKTLAELEAIAAGGASDDPPGRVH